METIHVVLALGLGLLAILAWVARATVATLRRVSPLVDEARADLARVTDVVDQDVRSAVQRIDGVASEIEGAVRPVRKLTEKGEQLLANPATVVVPPVLSAVVTAAKNVASGTPTTASAAPAPVAAPWQATAAVAASALTVVLQVATLIYIRKRFNDLDCAVRGLGQQLQVGHLISLNTVTVPFRAAHSRLEVICARADGQTEAQMTEAEVEELTGHILLGLSSLKVLAADLGQVELLRQPHIGMHVAEQLRVVDDVLSQLTDNQEVLVKRLCSLCTVRATEVRAAWLDTITVPLAKPGAVRRDLAKLVGVPAKQRQRELALAFAAQ